MTKFGGSRRDRMKGIHGIDPKELDPKTHKKTHSCQLSREVGQAIALVF
jgi:hypothetical protein